MIQTLLSRFGWRRIRLCQFLYLTTADGVTGIDLSNQRSTYQGRHMLAANVNTMLDRDSRVEVSCSVVNDLPYRAMR
jgi:hypothetical protein